MHYFNELLKLEASMFKHYATDLVVIGKCSKLENINRYTLKIIHSGTKIVEDNRM